MKSLFANIALISVAYFSQGVYSRPSYLSDCSLVLNSAPNGAFDRMGISNFDASTTDCTISIQGDITEYTPAASYTVTVTSKSSLARAIATTAGTFSSGGAAKGSSCRTEDTKSTSSTYTFVAPVSGTAIISALCGSNNAGVVYTAPKLTLTAPQSSSPSTSPTSPTTKTPSKSPSKAPTKAPTTPTNLPSTSPTKSPSKAPTKAPTRTPTNSPSTSPTSPTTKTPSKSPSKSPTKAPTAPTTKTPTKSPSKGTAPTKKTASSSQSVKVKLFATIIVIAFASIILA